MGSELPEDMLILIFANLEASDLVRAASVCSSWHRAYTSLIGLKLWKPQQHAPCLLYTVKSSGASAAGLCSIVEKKPYTLSLPDPPIRSRHFLSSAFGWIITADEMSELHLLNPITGDQIALPPITTIKQVTPIYDENGAVEGYHSWAACNSESDPPDVFGLSELRDYFFQKAFLSSDPSTGSYTVVLIHNTWFRLSYARAGDHCWTPLPPHENFADCVFKDDLMYGLNQYGEIIEFDFSDAWVKQKVVLDKMRTHVTDLPMHIVQTPCGDLLQIWWDCQTELNSRDEEADNCLKPESDLGIFNYTYYSILLKMYRVNLASNKPEEITSLGENVLFLGQNQSLCLRAPDHPQLKANHIYFTDLEWFIAVGRENSKRDIGVLNLDNNIREEIACPQIWSNWPSPVWITPNPRKATLLPQLTLQEVASCCTVGEGPADGKTMSPSKVAATTENYFLQFIAFFVFGLLGKIRSICCLILKKASQYRER